MGLLKVGLVYRSTGSAALIGAFAFLLFPRAISAQPAAPADAAPNAAPETAPAAPAEPAPAAPPPAPATPLAAPEPAPPEAPPPTAFAPLKLESANASIK